MTRQFRIRLDSEDPYLIELLSAVATEQGSQIDVRTFTANRDEEFACDLCVLHIVNDDDLAKARFLLEHTSAGEHSSKLVCILDRSDPRAELALLRAGAWDVFTRPLNRNRLSFILQQLALTRQADVSAVGNAGRVATAKAHPPTKILTLAELQSRAFESGILFRGERMLRLMDNLRPIIKRDSTILISGETGTGKTQLARLVHDLSPRRGEPFVVANCAAMTPSLLESELFGHVRGAFTGATEARDGKFRAAGAGTLFLDEIDSLPPAGQQRLLRVLDQRVYEKVGGDKTEAMRARVIAAANRPLEELLATGQFRSDLYYRLKVVAVELPALRLRPEDIAPIAGHLVREEALRDGDPVPEVSNELWEHLSRHDWPGNIRELRNVISQMVMFSGGRPLTVDALPESFSDGSSRRSEAFANFESPFSDGERFRGSGDEPREDDFPPLPAGGQMSLMLPLERERALGEAGRIMRELQRHNHNRTQTAASLGISRNALYKKIKKLSLIGLL